MGRLIAWEWQFFAIAVMWGMVLAACYDCLRILRRVFIHRKILMLAVEDIIFWMLSGFAMFHVIFLVNDGIIRSFALLGFLLGGAMYQYTVSYYLVKYISKVLLLFRRTLVKILRKLLINPLKKLCKSITIKLSKIRNENKEKHRLKKAGKDSDGKIRDKKEQRAKTQKTKTF